MRGKQNDGIKDTEMLSHLTNSFNIKTNHIFQFMELWFAFPFPVGGSSLLTLRASSSRTKWRHEATDMNPFISGYTPFKLISNGITTQTLPFMKRSRLLFFLKAPGK